jgi:Holliday junction resolvase RusA-like endonuclease
VNFFLAKPQSAPKKSTCMVVRPDCSKLVRAVSDSLTGIVFFDDAQVVQIEATKYYELPERVEIEVSRFV